VPLPPELLLYLESTRDIMHKHKNSNEIHMNPCKEDKQQSKYTCIMCLAVLSSLLNFSRGGVSVPGAVASLDGDSTALVAVVKHLLGEVAEAKGQ